MISSHIHLMIYIFFQKLSTPWIKILKSRPMWALMATQSAHTWGFWMLLTKIPSYFQAVFKVNIKEVSKRKIVRYIIFNLNLLIIVLICN